jgi:hypothetical protein
LLAVNLGVLERKADAMKGYTWFANLALRSSTVGLIKS